MGALVLVNLRKYSPRVCVELQSPNICFVKMIYFSWMVYSKTLSVAITYSAKT
jgi:hypothetical protein